MPRRPVTRSRTAAERKLQAIGPPEYLDDEQVEQRAGTRGAQVVHASVYSNSNGEDVAVAVCYSDGLPPFGVSLTVDLCRKAGLIAPDSDEPFRMSIETGILYGCGLVAERALTSDLCVILHTNSDFFVHGFYGLNRIYLSDEHRRHAVLRLWSVIQHIGVFNVYNCYENETMPKAMDMAHRVMHQASLLRLASEDDGSQDDRPFWSDREDDDC